MKFFYADALEHRRHLKLSALFDLCFPSPGLPGALPADADGLWLAADENDELTGCLLLFQTDLHSWEGIPFVHPAYRRKGIFSALLANACQKGNCPGEDDLFFSVRPTQTLWLEGIPFVHPAYRRKGIFSALLANACQKGNCPGEDDLFFSVRPTQTLWLQVLNSIEAEKAFDEYMMEYSFQNLPSARLKTEADFSDELTVSFQGTEGMASCPHVSCLLSAHGSSVYLYQLLTEEAFRGADFSDELTVSFQGTEGMASCPHVSCLLSAHGSSVYLYQLLTEEAFRGQGRALAFLHHLFPRLKALGFSSVRLQVSGENLPAMALYKKTGFHITETLSFYLY